MKIVSLGRQEGKTTIIAKYLEDHPDAYAIVPTHLQRIRMRKQYPKIKSRIHTLKSIKTIRGVGELVIDDIDWMFYQMFGAPVELVTITRESDPDACTRENLNKPLYWGFRIEEEK